MTKRFTTENTILGLAYGLIHLLHDLRSPKEYIYSLAKPVALVYAAGYTAGTYFFRAKPYITRRIYGV